MGAFRQYPFTVVTAAADEPVSLEEAKDFLEIDSDILTHDLKITNFIKDAREQVEFRLGRKLVSQTLNMKLDNFYGFIIEIPVAPITAVNSVKYYDNDDTQQTLLGGSPQDYRAVLDGDGPSWVQPVTGWPATYPRPQVVEVEFVAGYADGDNVPESIKDAMKMIVAHRMEFREPFIFGQTHGVSMAIDFCLDPYRVYYSD